MRIHVVARNIDVLTSEAKYPCGRQKRQRGSVGSCAGFIGALMKSKGIHREERVAAVMADWLTIGALIK